eukprot:scaffold77050_cov44-Cyclotella_meneghiniana.AAC.3
MTTSKGRDRKVFSIEREEADGSHVTYTSKEDIERVAGQTILASDIVWPTPLQSCLTTSYYRMLGSLEMARLLRRY